MAAPSVGSIRCAVGAGVTVCLLVFGAPFVSTAQAVTVGCGEVITQSTTLTADVGPCPGDGIIIGANNITLNLNGHEIFGTAGPGDGNQAGIRLPFRTGVTITSGRGPERTGTVRDFDAGVFINGGSRNNIGNLNIRDNVGPGGDAVLSDGIVLFHSAKNRLINNLVAHNGPFDGIGVLGVDSSYNVIKSNTVEETVSSEGDVVFDGVGILINNFLDEEGTPRRGEPIRENDVIDNVVRLNDNSGISNITNVKSQIRGNLVQDNGQRGEFCFDNNAGSGPELIFCRPAAEPSNGIGFTVGPATPRVTTAFIGGNSVTGNVGNGIYIATENNRIIGNTSLRNGGSGRPGSGVNVFGGRRYDLHNVEFLRDRTEAPKVCGGNIWSRNIFETAFPDCVYEQQGQTPPPPPPDGGGGPIIGPPPDGGGGPIIGPPPDGGGGPIIGPPLP